MDLKCKDADKDGVALRAPEGCTTVAVVRRAQTPEGLQLYSVLFRPRILTGSVLEMILYVPRVRIDYSWSWKYLEN